MCFVLQEARLDQPNSVALCNWSLLLLTNSYAIRYPRPQPLESFAHDNELSLVDVLPPQIERPSSLRVCI